MLSPYMSPVERVWFYSLRILCGLILLFLVLPVLVIVPLSFNSGSFLVYPLQGFSLHWYQDFFASAEQALYTANGGSILSWAGANGNNITTQIINEADAKKAAEKLYLSILSRLPSEAESKDVETYLASRPDQKPAAAQELVWGLVASVEFRMNH